MLSSIIAALSQEIVPEGNLKAPTVFCCFCEYVCLRHVASLKAFLAWDQAS